MGIRVPTPAFKHFEALGFTTAGIIAAGPVAAGVQSSWYGGLTGGLFAAAQVLTLHL